jgi:hypothetical protein
MVVSAILVTSRKQNFPWESYLGILVSRWCSRDFLVVSAILELWKKGMAIEKLVSRYWYLTG